MALPWDPSTLARLSAPGFNRAIGAGDVIPYLPTNFQRQDTAETGQGELQSATPGPSGQFGNTPATPGIPGSWLQNLSALTPLLNQIFANAQGAGTAGSAGAPPAAGAPPSSSDYSATPSGPGAAVSGPSSDTLGAMQPAGAPPSVAPPVAAGPPPGYMMFNGQMMNPSTGAVWDPNASAAPSPAAPAWWDTFANGGSGTGAPGSADSGAAAGAGPAGEAGDGGAAGAGAGTAM